jgi:hypothetical protein
MGNESISDKAKPKDAIQVPLRKGETEDHASARILTKPEVQAALSIHHWQGRIIDVNDIADELARQVNEVNKGELSRPEAMLTAQAHTLDELFNNLARRACGQDSLHGMEAMLRLALKAQSQCRATLETLAAIKNPPIIYAKQANISSGHQQVNNGVPSAQVGENKNQQNELLDIDDGKRLDIGKTGKTITTHQAMATVD